MRASDAAGNTTDRSITFTFDREAPSLNDAKLTRAGKLLLAFSEPIKADATAIDSIIANLAPAVGKSLGSTSPTGVALSPVSGSEIYARALEITLGAGSTLAANDSLTLNSAANVRDAAGNLAITQSKAVADTDITAPGLTISVTPTTLGRGQQATVTFSFDEAVRDFVASDVVITGGGQLGPLVRTSPTAFTAAYQPGANQNNPATLSVAEGAYSDLVGNLGPAGSVNITVDSTPPGAPTTLVLATDSGAVNNDSITNVGTMNVTLSGSSDDKAKWEYSTNGGTNWATGIGTSFTLSEESYTAGSIRVRQFDTAGNVSAVKSSATAITVDQKAPDAVDLASGTDGVQGTATVTVNAAEAMAGKAIAGSIAAPPALDITSVRLDMGGASLDLAKDKLMLDVDRALDANFQVTAGVSVGGVSVVYDYEVDSNALTFKKAGGGALAGVEIEAVVSAIQFKSESENQGIRTITVAYTDVAGNTGTPGTVTLSLGTLAPAAPDVDNITVAADNKINDAEKGSVTLVGAAGAVQAHAKVLVSVDDGDANTPAVTAQGIAGEDGSFSLSGVNVGGLVDGPLTFSFKAEDEVGNVSASPFTKSVPKDTVAPTASAFTVSSTSVGATANEAGVMGLYDMSGALLVKAGGGTLSRLLKNRGKDVDMLEVVTIVVSCRAIDQALK